MLKTLEDGNLILLAATSSSRKLSLKWNQKKKKKKSQKVLKNERETEVGKHENQFAPWHSNALYLPVGWSLGWDAALGVGSRFLWLRALPVGSAFSGVTQHLNSIFRVRFKPDSCTCSIPLTLQTLQLVQSSWDNVGKILWLRSQTAGVQFSTLLFITCKTLTNYLCFSFVICNTTGIVPSSKGCC